MDEVEAQADSGPRYWVGAIGAITALLVAITGLVHACSGPGGVQPAPTSARSSIPLTAPLAPPAKAITLLWVPSDCTEGAHAGIALDSCKEGRTLEWLKLAMEGLRGQGRFGFGQLPKGFQLEAGDSAGHANYKLTVQDRDGRSLFSVGVGYNLKKNTKDGGLHVYNSGVTIAEAWLRADGSWSAAESP
jgi:hypothetical protein